MFYWDQIKSEVDTLPRQKPNESLYMGWVVTPLGKIGKIALWSKTLTESLCVCAIIVNHIILLHPLNPPLIRIIKRLPVPCSFIGVWLARRSTIRPYASIGIEVRVGGSEGRLVPIDFYKSTSCGPVISIPETGV